MCELSLRNELSSTFIAAARIRDRDSTGMASCPLYGYCGSAPLSVVPLIRSALRGGSGFLRGIVLKWSTFAALPDPTGARHLIYAPAAIQRKKPLFSFVA
jgi:hypothetical protein